MLQIHQAQSSPEAASLHLTVSTALNNTWSEFLRLLLPVALEMVTQSDVDFRRSLPVDMAEYMGVVHDPADQDSDEGNSSGSDEPSDDAHRKLRASFSGRVRELLYAGTTREQMLLGL